MVHLALGLKPPLMSLDNIVCHLKVWLSTQYVHWEYQNAHPASHGNKVIPCNILQTRLVFQSPETCLQPALDNILPLHNIRVKKFLAKGEADKKGRDEQIKCDDFIEDNPRNDQRYETIMKIYMLYEFYYQLIIDVWCTKTVTKRSTQVRGAELYISTSDIIWH